MEHPFYDPVARGKNAPAYSLSGRPRKLHRRMKNFQSLLLSADRTVLGHVGELGS